MKTLSRTLNNSADLAKTLGSVLELQNFDSAENAKVNRQIGMMQS